MLAKKFQIFTKISFYLFFQSWNSYFRNNSYTAPPTLATLPKNTVPVSQYLGADVGSAGTGLVPAGSINDKLIDDHLAVQAIIRSYQVKF